MYFQRLEDLRVDADLTQEQVAQVLHLSLIHISLPPGEVAERSEDG